MDLTSVLIALATLCLAIYWFICDRYRYWSKHQIPFIKPIFPYGSVKGTMETIQINKSTQDFYKQFKGKGPFGGIYGVLAPMLLATDLDFIKRILIKDFTSFEDRPVYFNKDTDPISAHLFALDGEGWRKLRPKLSPTFTSGKMKFMFPTIVQVGDNLINAINRIIDASASKTSEIIEIKDILARFTTDVIGTCAFGIECNSLENPNAIFMKMGRKIFVEPRHSILLGFIIISFEKVCKRIGIKAIGDDVSEFFTKIVKETISFREEKHVERNDFMDILIKLKNLDDKTQSLTIDEIVAQSFVFFIAGFETSSTAMTFAFYELAQNQAIQDRARAEIQSVLKRHDGQFTFAAMNEMTYLEQIIDETLRKYPPLGILFRTASKNYYVPEFDFTIEKGTGIWIPNYAIQNDPEYFPEPDRFDPERFAPDAVKERNPLTYMPFGDGPRNCIGLRFGLMQTRVGLATIIANFKITLCDKTPIPLELNPKEFIMSPKGGIPVRVTKIQ